MKEIIIENSDLSAYVFKKISLKNINGTDKIVDYICMWIIEHDRNISFVEECTKESLKEEFNTDNISDYEILDSNTTTIMYVDKNLNKILMN